MWILADLAVELFAESYLWSPICDEDCLLTECQFLIWGNTRYPGVPRDLQRHLVNLAAICVAHGLQQFPPLKDVLSIVLSDKIAPKKRFTSIFALF